MTDGNVSSMWEIKRSVRLGVTLFWPSITLLASGMVISCSPAPTAPQRAVHVCPPVDAYAQKWTGGFVQRRETARIIANAMLLELNAPDKLEDRKPARIIDSGSEWVVIQSLKPGDFGGDTSFRINKCTGVITQLRFEE